MPNQTLTGSCLCGGVRYTVNGELQRFVHCHCSRCRKATGTGHASNLFVRGTLEWQSGEDQVRAYKVPEAERFANAFCTQCGARVPRFSPQLQLVMVPAGSLDDVPDMLPSARIFQDSRAPWSCDGTELPGFAQYPG
ncbi:aldehyde-activating protein [Pseudoxanthomonas kalamensis DSM 18571]|uniref:GFA family protein n=1 Tax=Pseudoxanthomonas kalamensis TaxID=289483 RepID=UPI0013917681|nr:GFA family protein [Pseudoxanthomonas kalamensis]KAF1712137.1 aldehyde-activating protein [Pseudoxanthomonas kalamensis DSM 18571]